MTSPKKNHRDATSVAVMRAAEEAAELVRAARERRLAKRDREYQRQLAKNPEGNNRNKGNAPVGRIARRGAKARQNHSGMHLSKPSY